MKRSRMKAVRRNDITALEDRRDTLLAKLAPAVTRLRRASSIHDRIVDQLQRTQDQIVNLKLEASRVADRLIGSK